MQKYEGIRIIASYACKRNCKFCYQSTKTGGYLNIIKAEKIISNLEFIPSYITFMGGELSYFPEETYKLISAVHNKLPMVYAKSLTTNGDGDINWYKSLYSAGLTRFTFSIHNLRFAKQIFNKVETLGKLPYFTVRINSFFDILHLDIVKEIIEFCKFNGIPLTLCDDINREDQGVSFYKEILYSILPESNIKVFNNYFIIDNDGFQIWLFRHNNNYNNNNLIILPDGSCSDNFEDVKQCKGNINV